MIWNYKNLRTLQTSNQNTHFKEQLSMMKFHRLTDQTDGSRNVQTYDSCWQGFRETHAHRLRMKSLFVVTTTTVYTAHSTQEDGKTVWTSARGGL